MASIFSWLRKVWSGSRNEPYREFTVSYTSPHPHPQPPPHVTQTLPLQGPTATTSELPVTDVSYPDLHGAVEGLLNLHLDATNNTFTSIPSIGVDPVSGSVLGPGGVVHLRLNTSDNTWTSDRPLFFDPLNERTPELGGGRTGSSSRAATSSPSTVQRSGHGGSPGSVLSSTSVTSASERGQSTRRRERNASTASRTERGDSTHRTHGDSASSGQTMSPALSNAASIPSLSETELFNPGRSERGASSESRTVRGDSRRSHGRSGSSSRILFPAPDHKSPDPKSTPEPSSYHSRGFNTTFSPPTPPESFAVPLGGPVINRKGSSSLSPSGSSRQVNSQPEMEQILPPRARPIAAANSARTPSKPSRNSTADSYTSNGGAALVTPPRTDSVTRQAILTLGARTGESSRRVEPPSPTSPCPSHRTIDAPVAAFQASPTNNPPVTFAQPFVPTSSPPTVTQPQAPQVSEHPTVVDPTTRDSMRPSPTMEFTSLREIYAQPLVNGYRVLPTRGPECLECNQKMDLQPPTGGGVNKGRRYYMCATHEWKYGTFADLEGRDDSRTCGCGEASRRTEQKRGGYFWKCMEMKCEWKVFS
ncbi:hypothetical protein V8F20_009089 [Naviculisporaceae sp. PSN 640]